MLLVTLFFWSGVFVAAASPVVSPNPGNARRVQQAHSVDEAGLLRLHANVTVNAAAGRVRQEICAGAWTWWSDKASQEHTGSEAQSDTLVVQKFQLQWMRFAHSDVTLHCNVSNTATRAAAAGAKDSSVPVVVGELSGQLSGNLVLSFVPHPHIVGRSVLRVELSKVRVTRSLWQVTGSNVLARGLLRAFRGDLSSFFGGKTIRGFTGLVRRLEGSQGWKHDIVEPPQLTPLVAPQALLWTPRLDTTDDSTTVLAVGSIPFAEAFTSNHTDSDEEDAERLIDIRDAHGEPERRESNSVFVQFLLWVDREVDETENAVTGNSRWTVRSSVKMDFVHVSENEDEAPERAFSIRLATDSGEQTQAQLHLQLQGHAESASHDSASGGDSSSFRSLHTRVALATLPPSVTGQLLHLSLSFTSNWTILVSIDGRAPVRVVVPEPLREDLLNRLEHVNAVLLRSSDRRAAAEALLVTQDRASFNELSYFSLSRVDASRDAYALGPGAGAGVRIPWTRLFLIVSVIVIVPVIVARLASFDSSLIPARGLDKPLLYFRLAPSAAITHKIAAGVAGFSFFLAAVAYWGGSPGAAFPTVAVAAQYLFWRIAVSVLVVQRLVESYLWFKSSIDKLTEKSYRVAFPFFDFQYWLWMNRVALVGHVLETCCLLIVSMTNGTNLQFAGSLLFCIFLCIEMVAHYQVFGEIRRSYQQDSLIGRLRVIINAALGTLLVAVFLRVLEFITSGSFPGVSLTSAASEWALFGVSFAWHHTVQQEFVAPEDTRLYVGRRIALGASVRCSECFRPFSRSRARETCADCRDECCSECGVEVNMGDLGATVDMLCFFCGKCNKLLVAEATSSRARRAAKAAEQSKEICRMYQRGECTYGETCKYMHVEPKVRPRTTTAGTGPNGARARTGTTGTTKRYNAGGGAVSDSGVTTYVGFGDSTTDLSGSSLSSVPSLVMTPVVNPPTPKSPRAAGAIKAIGSMSGSSSMASVIASSQGSKGALSGSSRRVQNHPSSHHPSSGPSSVTSSMSDMPMIETSKDVIGGVLRTSDPVYSSQMASSMAKARHARVGMAATSIPSNKPVNAAAAVAASGSGSVGAVGLNSSASIAAGASKDEIKSLSSSSANAIGSSGLPGANESPENLDESGPIGEKKKKRRGKRGKKKKGERTSAGNNELDHPLTMEEEDEKDDGNADDEDL